MSAEELHELIDTLAATPERIAGLVRDLPDSDLRRSSPDGEFSAIENVCHLRDIEVEGYTARINRILNEDQPFLPDIDGGRLAIERNYNGRNLDEALKTFGGARAENLRTLGNVKPEQLSRAGMLEGVGAVTLEQVLLLMREHDEGHVDDLRIIRQRFRQ